MYKSVINTLSLKNVPPPLTNKKTALIIKYWWLIIISVLLRWMPFLFPTTSSLVDFKRVCMILSYILLLFVLLNNIHIRGIWSIIFGTFLNFVAIMTNGGFMPVSPTARYLAGKALLEMPTHGIVLNGSGGIILPISQSKLWLLTDILPISFVHVVLSIGDILIGIGVLVVCIILIVQAVKKTPTPILNSSITK
ncbi:MAG: DUF5317 domain-containing protein [Dehalococcoidales bacterium]